ncbi:hypothetical protein P152DRAFT_477671 [Eremomyces bilateralis CBS 781.70]|uniref:Zn(2)-C6 fungal-type domain-containing protein n=1 Tax=Eremomyces bilateralis CBS 781.70 TaxID=1392243 RepID=A0A6G1FQE6_9PEZI|nr:uncharacterized protein P152DRAFT_477671 [Eremomyces bilateralis CBS 781.70]KAF1808017.1 hypothetical protein P152DRAFT_477671 [Eremomyces bilateralis CBS 781.70]
MSNPQSYPSPDAAQVTTGAAPFYSHNGASAAANEIRADMELSAELQRATAPLIARNQEDQAHHVPRVQTPTQPPNQSDVLTEPLPPYQHQHHYSLADVSDIGSGPGKRQKASRACDGCRQKKIKCDLAPDQQDACRNCKKAGIRCQFTRQQLKRGPSKGYIKELADRVQSLEQSLNPFNSQPNAHDTDFSYVQNLANFNGESGTESTPTNPRKRTYSASQGIHDLALAQQDGFRLPSAGPQDGARDAQPQQDDDDDWFNMDLTQDLGLPEWNYTIVSDYYERMHQQLPFLPKSIVQLRQRLTLCRPTLRRAFTLALECFIRSCPGSKLPQDAEFREQFQTVSKLLQFWHYEDPINAAFHNSLVYVQALVLMHLASENQTLHDKHTVTSRSEWLARAIGQSKHLRLEEPRGRATILDGDLSQDTDERLARRIFYTIYVLDQWHAISLCQSALLPDYGMSTMHEDAAILGPELHFLKRSALILGDLVKTVKACSLLPRDPLLAHLDPSSPATLILTGFTNATLSLFRDLAADLLPTIPHLELLYHHLQLLLLRFAPAPHPPPPPPPPPPPSSPPPAASSKSSPRPIRPYQPHLPPSTTTASPTPHSPSTNSAPGAIPVRADGNDWNTATRELCRRKHRVFSGEGGGVEAARAAAVAAEGQLGGGWDAKEVVVFGYLRYLDRGSGEGEGNGAV